METKTPEDGEYDLYSYEHPYVSRYDSFFSLKLDEWLSCACSDTDCSFCANRPQRPSDAMPNLFPPRGYSREFDKDLTLPPGDLVDRLRHHALMSKSRFCNLMGMDRCDYHELRNGDISIDREMANKLVEIFGGSISFWLNRQKHTGITITEDECEDG